MHGRIITILHSIYGRTSTVVVVQTVYGDGTDVRGESCVHKSTFGAAAWKWRFGKCVSARPTATLIHIIYTPRKREIQRRMKKKKTDKTPGSSEIFETQVRYCSRKNESELERRWVHQNIIFLKMVGYCNTTKLFHNTVGWTLNVLTFP